MTAEADYLPVAVRAYVPPGHAAFSAARSASRTSSGERVAARRNHGSEQPSDWTLVTDVVAAADAAQHLRIGAYQLRKAGRLYERGFFYDDTLTQAERDAITPVARSLDARVMSRDEFAAKLFMRYGYDLRAAIIGAKLSFALSRIATKIGQAHGSKKDYGEPNPHTMKGAFSLKIGSNKTDPQIRIKAINGHLARFDFAGAPWRQYKRPRRGPEDPPARRGAFLDVLSAAEALHSKPYSLRGLCELLQTETRLLSGAKLEPEISRADGLARQCMNQVQAIWECSEILQRQWGELCIPNTPLRHLYSGAGIGRAYFKEARLRPSLQPEFRPAVLGKIMQTFYAGRAEIRWRRRELQVAYGDFKSMYPTVFTLCNLDWFLIAEGTECYDCTEQVKDLLSLTELDHWQHGETWREPIPGGSLATIVKILPDKDILPVRAMYADDFNEGDNEFTSEHAFWYTLPHCIASKLRTGKAPKVIEAIGFRPLEPQPNLRPITVAGAHIDLYEGGLFRKLVELRDGHKDRLKALTRSPSGASLSPDQRAEKERLSRAEKTLKVITNAAAFGNFIQINCVDLEPLRKRDRERLAQEGIIIPPGKDWRKRQGWCGGDEPVTVIARHEEIPGAYFQPLIATTVTGAARLMLACLEELVLKSGLDWAFCDTDGAAIAKVPRIIEEGVYDKDGELIGVEERRETLSNAEFQRKIRDIQNWFEPLYPYNTPGDLLRLEPENFDPDNGKWKPLYCMAISSKRYVLYNKTRDGDPIIRKASEQGLGQWVAPYDKPIEGLRIPDPLPSLLEDGLSRWQYDFWFLLLSELLDGSDIGLMEWKSSLRPYWNKPVASRFSITKPDILKWFDDYNRERLEHERIRAWNTILSFCEQEWSGYFISPNPASAEIFDRETGAPITDDTQLRTYWEIYHDHPKTLEHKSVGEWLPNGSLSVTGELHRRHVRPSRIRWIGKETNKWQEMFERNEIDPDADIAYGEIDGDKPPAQKAVSPFQVSKYRPKKLSVTSPEIALTDEDIRWCSTGYWEEVPVIAILSEFASVAGQRSLAELLSVSQTQLSFVINGRRSLIGQARARALIAIAGCIVAGLLQLVANILRPLLEEWRATDRLLGEREVEDEDDWSVHDGMRAVEPIV
jgi:hypothetical protein